MNPWLPFEWIAALRFMREGRTQTTLIVAGVATVWVVGELLH